MPSAHVNPERDRQPDSGRAPDPHDAVNLATRTVHVPGLRSDLTVTGNLHERIAQIAGHQRGRIARRQLLAAGAGYSSINWFVASGRLKPKHRGVYAVGHDAPAPLAAATEVLLALRDGSALSHLTAAALWGLIPEPGPAAQLHTTVPGGTAGAALNVVLVHRARRLAPGDVRVRRGLPLTSPARTLLD
ncbi:MAG: hypothetical protein ACRDL5_01305, partial [Solirubrobacteraceae bacterium]